MVVGKLANDMVQCENKIDLELFFQDWWKNCDGRLFSLGGFFVGDCGKWLAESVLWGCGTGRS